MWSTNLARRHSFEQHGIPDREANSPCRLVFLFNGLPKHSSWYWKQLDFQAQDFWDLLRYSIQPLQIPPNLRLFALDVWCSTVTSLSIDEVDGGRHDVVRYLVEKKAETNWLVRASGPKTSSLPFVHVSRMTSDSVRCQDNDQCSVQHCAAFQGEVFFCDHFYRHHPTLHVSSGSSLPMLVPVLDTWIARFSIHVQLVVVQRVLEEGGTFSAISFHLDWRLKDIGG